MSAVDKKRIDELLSLYALESVKDIYVEGAFDKDVFDWFLRMNGRNDIAVYSIQDVEIPIEKFEQYKLPYPSNRSKLIALSCELAGSKKIESNVLCIADRDFEDFLPKWPTNSFLAYTDFNSLESYALDLEIMRKFISIGLGGLPLDANVLIPQLFSVLKSIFFIRLANEKLSWGMKWVNINKYLIVCRDSISFDYQSFITALLQKNNRAASQEELQNEIHNLITVAPKEIKLLIRGHDFMETLHIVAKKLRANRNYGDEHFFSGAFISSLGVGTLSNYSLFKTLMEL